MTMQISDSYIYKGKDYDLIATGTNFDFEIEVLGLKPVMISSDCLRGYEATYTIENGLFQLKDLIVSQDEEFPVINGVDAGEHSAYLYEDFVMECFDIEEFEENDSINESNDITTLVEEEDYKIQEKIYKDVNLTIDYTGSILLGSEFMTTKYCRYEKQPYGYSEVYEVILDQGKVVEVKYRSKEMRQVRTTVNRLGRRKVLEEIGLDKCIKEIFDLDYELMLYIN